eukprot:jgi/Mesen1/9542/ME000064S08889
MQRRSMAAVPAAPGIRLIEIAANLTDGMFQGVYNGKQAHPPDMPAVLGRAWAAGVERIIITGGSLEESRAALALANTDGTAPVLHGGGASNKMLGLMALSQEFDASGNSENHLRQLAELVREGVSSGKVVAIGECGLDYDRLHFCPPDVQRKYFERQFDLAEATQLPMFLHLRAATDDFLDIVERNKHRFVAGVVHSFTENAADRDRVLAVDNLYIGVNGCSLKTQENLEVMAGIPAERMMLETDSPYCEIRPSHAGSAHVATAWPSRKKEKHEVDATVKSRNEPCHIRQVLDVVAGHRGVIDRAGFAGTIFENTVRVFFPRDRKITP